MTFANWVLVAVGLFAILGAVGAFTIAFRRARAERPDPTAGVSAETLRADRSMAGVRVDVSSALAEEGGAEGGAVAVVTAPAEAEEEGAEAEAHEALELIETQRVVEVTPEESGVSRRQFFNRAIAGTFFAFLGMQGLYYLAFFWPKITGGFGSNVDAGPVDDLKSQTVTASGSVVPVFIPEARAYVVPAPATLSSEFAGKGVEAGGLFALYQRCVHLGCRVPWCASSVGFECPCHGSKYNSVGEYYAGPAPRNLDRFQVEVNNANRLIIKTGTIIQTPRAPIPSVKYPQGPHCI